jgi:predicted dehydrogenase
MDGMTYAPRSQKQGERVVGEYEFPFAVVGLDHGHIFAMTNGLLEAGATLVWVYDDDPQKVSEFVRRYPQAKPAPCIDQILADADIRLVASAVKPCDRCALGLQVLEHQKHYFCDKPGMLTLQEIALAKEACARTNFRYFVYFGERVHVEGALYAQQLIEEGKLGKVLSVTILAPHRLNKPSRPLWFFNPEENGGILVDIGSHQIEQFLTYAGAKDAHVLESCVANYHTPDHPQFSDYGHCTLLADNHAVCHFRVDWFTPDGLGAWGDGRVFIVGTKATIEIRKYLDVARSTEGDQVYLVDETGEHHIAAYGTIGYPFFGKLILDCLHHREDAISQEHTFLAMRLAIEAQNQALKLDSSVPTP